MAGSAGKAARFRTNHRTGNRDRALSGEHFRVVAFGQPGAGPKCHGINLRIDAEAQAKPAEAAFGQFRLVDWTAAIAILRAQAHG
ncbi:MAG: hypothetical protein OSB58_07310 [Alphaproteobacteria bacterium]|nr:hypothetical protein [Alphaproteobacteria bacterium]